MTRIAFARAQEGDNSTQKAMQNLLNHLPSEAVGLYLAGLDAVGRQAEASTLIFIALVSLAVLLLVRFLAKASTQIIVSSVIAYVIWIYAIGNGPFQALGLVLAPGIGAFLVVAYSTVITVLATSGVIKDT